MTEAPPPPTAQTGTETPGGSATPSRPPLRRTTGDRVLAGVAGGLARTLGVEPVVVRIGLVIAGVVAFPVVLAYVAGWLLLPEDDAPAPAPASQRTDAGFWFGVALLAVVVVGLAASLDGPGSGPLVALALVGVGVALYRRDDGTPTAPGRTTTTAAATGPATPRLPDDVAPGERSQEAHPVPPGTDGGGATPPPVPPTAVHATPPAPPPAPPRRRSVLGWLTVGLALIAAGVAAWLDAAGVAVLDGTQVAAVAMAVLGLGLLVGAVVGRARWLALLALVLLPVVGAGSAVRGIEDAAGVDLPGAAAFDAGVGERRVDLRPDELPGDVEFGLGELEVDYADLQPGAFVADQEVLVDVQLGVGEVRVLLPRDVRWVVQAGVGLGDISVEDSDGSRSLASGAGRTVSLEGGPDAGPVLQLDVDTGLGEIVLVVPADDLR